MKQFFAGLVKGILATVFIGIVAGLFVPASGGSQLLGAPSVLFPTQGGLGISTIPVNGQFVIGSSTGQYYTPTTSLISFKNGSLGLGTSTPSTAAQLTIANTNSGAAGVNILAPNVSAAPWIRMSVGDLDAAEIRNQNGFYFISLLSSNNNTFSTISGDFVINGGGSGTTEYLRVKNGGNVGIGTAVPSSTLHVVGTSILGSASSTNFYVSNSFIWDTQNITVSTTLTGTNNRVVNITAISGDTNVYLPPATSPGQIVTIADSTGNIGAGNQTNGWMVYIYPTSTNHITGEKIYSGQGAVIIIDPSGTASFISDGAGNWRITGLSGAITAPWSWNGIILWLESDHGITLNGTASTSKWADTLSTSTNFLAQSNVTLQPQYNASSSSVKNRPVLTFDGVGTTMSTSTMSGVGNMNGPNTMGGVYNRKDSISSATLVSYGATAFHGIGKNAASQAWWFAGTGDSQPQTDWSNSSTHAFTRQFGGLTTSAQYSPAGKLSMYVDYQFWDNSIAGGGAMTNVTVTSPGMQIGNGIAGLLNGEIAAAFFFQRRLSDPESILIQRYLIGKYEK